jgi:ABC-type transport system substrate-binding protein
MRKISFGLTSLLFVLAAALMFAPATTAQPLTLLDCSGGPTAITGRGAAGSIFDCGSTGGVYTYDTIAAPSVLNTISAQDTASNAIMDHVLGGGTFTDFNNLGRGATGLAPQAASVVAVSDDGTSVTYTLRNFNYGQLNGSSETVTVQDIVDTYYSIVWNPNIPNSTSTAQTCPSDGSPYRLEVLSDSQVRISCPSQFRTFTGNASGFFVYSGNMIRELVADQGIATQLAIAPGANGILDTAPSGDDSVSGPMIVDGGDGAITSAAGDDVEISIPTQEFLGLNANLNLIRATGPFLINSLNSQSLATYERNSNFYEVDSNGTQLPYLDELRIIIIPTAGQNLSLTNFLNGTTDANGLRPQDLAPVLSQAAAGGFTVNQDSINAGVAASGRNFSTPNMDDPDPNLAAAFRNQTVRQAVSLAFDRARFVNNVQLGLGSPQLTATNLVGIGLSFGSGRDNTCADLEAAFSGQGAFCDSPTGRWDVGGIAVNVTSLPNLSDAGTQRFVRCFFDHAGCVAEANSLLDSVGIVDTNGDGTRDVPANFDALVGNPGGSFAFPIQPNAGNTQREEISNIIAENMGEIGINAASTPISFPQLVSQLLSGTHSGMITIGLTGGDPAGGINVQPCGTPLHFWHLSCDESQTDGLAAPLADELALAKAWEAGFAATTVADAQVEFDKWDLLFLEVMPYFHTAIQNSLYAARTDRFDLNNMGRGISGGSDLKYRVD